MAEEIKEAIEQPKQEVVVEHKVKKRKKSGLRKFCDDVIQEDMHNVRDYIFTEVVVPTIRNTIVDIVCNGIEMVVYGEARGGSRTRSAISRGLSKISYRDYYDRDRRDRRDRDEPRRPVGYNFDDIIFESRSDAELVLMKLDECIERCGVATVADLMEFSGEEGKWTDNRYGWTDVRDVSPVHTRDGYILPLPKVRVID